MRREGDPAGRSPGLLGGGAGGSGTPPWSGPDNRALVFPASVPHSQMADGHPDILNFPPETPHPVQSDYLEGH